MILDTLYLLFKSDASQAKADMAALEKQIESLKAKGKQRSEQENKDLKESIARHKEMGEVLKNSQNAGSGLAASLGSAAAALVSFGAIRSGIINVSDFNSGLAVQSKLLGQNAKDLEILGHAAKLAGGSSEGALGNIAGIARMLLNTGSDGDVKSWLANVSADLDKKAGSDMRARRRVLQNQYPMITDPGLQSMALDPSELKRLMAESSKQITDKNSDYNRDRRIQENVASIEKNVQGIFDKINRLLPESASAALQSVPGGVVGGALAGFAGLKALKWLGIGGSAVGAGIGAGSAAAVAGIGVGAYQVTRGAMDAATGSRESLMGKGSQWLADKIIWRGYKKPTSAETSMSEIDYLMSKGLKRDEAAAVIGHMDAENPKRDLNARGDGGIAHGYMQWQNNSRNGFRRDKIKKATGIDVSTQGGTAQLDAILWEMEHGDTGFSMKKFQSLNGLAAKTAYMGSKYVRFAGSENHQGRGMLDRINNASNVFSSGGRGAGGSSNVQIDRIEVNTQATDAKGISRAIGDELHSTLRKVTTHFDDGAKY